MGQGVSGHHLSTIGGNGSPKGQGNLFGKSGTNKFTDTDEYPSDLEEGKQGKHIEGHPNFIQGKSVLTISMNEATELVKEFSGKGKVLGNPKTSNKEWIDFGIIIGIWLDENGNRNPTTKGIIHHSKNGTHIVPSNPEGEY